MNLFLIYSKSNFNFMKQIAVFFKKKNHKITFLLASEIFKKKINIIKDTEVFLYKDILDTNLRQQIKIRNNIVKYFFLFMVKVFS